MIIILLALAGIALAIFKVYSLINDKYKSFVEEHSIALKNLRAINSKYQFKTIGNYDMVHSYDNENFYNDISTMDYLIYQLDYIKNNVNVAMKETLENKNMYEAYCKEISSTCIMNKYDSDVLLKNKEKLNKYENVIFNSLKKNPTTVFSIRVTLVSKKINGAYRDRKSNVFEQNDIKNAIFKLNQKRGNFYINEDIWHSICRVERGMVSNKMRFLIYQRDGYRCCKCHRKTNDLEIDHIYPISKGGKSTYDNLQTLCHSCNKIKGSNIE